MSSLLIPKVHKTVALLLPYKILRQPTICACSGSAFIKGGIFRHVEGLSVHLNVAGARLRLANK